jgi:hypothetical protein
MPDKDTAPTQDTEQETQPAAGETSAQGGTQPTKPAENGGAQATKPSETKPGEGLLTRSEVNAILARKRKEWQREQQSAAQEAADEATRKANEEAGKWEPLYKQEQERAKSLKDQLAAVQAEVTEWRDMVAKQLDEQIKDWPQEVLDLDPGKDDENADLRLRLRWVQTAAPLVARMGGQPRNPGNPPSPEGAKHPAKPKELQEYEQQAAQRYQLNI